MKKSRSPIKFDFDNKHLIINRQFGARAAIFGSKEYNILTKIKQNYSDYEIVLRDFKKSEFEHYKGLTYAYMEYYISTHDDAEKRMEEYKEIRLRAECHSMKYGKIKKWFLLTYPQIDDFTPEAFKQMKENKDNELSRAS